MSSQETIKLMKNEEICESTKHMSFENKQEINLQIKGGLYNKDAGQLIAFLQTSISKISAEDNSTVHSFSLDVGYCNPVKFEAMRMLASSLSVFRNLTNLSLKFDTNTLDLQISTTEEIEALKKQFAGLPSLHSLSIDIKNSLTDDTQINIISQIFSQQTQLQRFKINLEDSLITNSGFASFCQLVGSLKQVKQLSVQISKNQRIIQQNQYLCLWDSLYQLKELEHLTVSVSECNLTKNGEIFMSENNCSSMQQLKTLSFKLLNGNNNDFSSIIQQQAYFLRHLPTLRELSVKCGDELKLNSYLIESIVEISNQLHRLRLHIGKNSQIDNQFQVERLLTNLAIQPESSLYVNSEVDFVGIQIKNKDYQVILDLNIAKDCKKQEQVFLRAAFLVTSPFMKSIKINFRRLEGVDDILNICDFTKLEELDIQVYSDDQNLSITSLFLESVSKSKIQSLNLKLIDIYSHLKQEVISRFENSLGILAFVKKCNVRFDLETLQFSLQFVETFLLNILLNQDLQYKFSKINTKYNDEMDEFFFFESLIPVLQLQAKLYIDLDFTIPRIIITMNNKSSLIFSVCKNTINQFIKGILFSSEGFLRMKNCTIRHVTSKFEVAFYKPSQVLQLQQEQNEPISYEGQEDFSNKPLSFLMNYFHNLSYIGENYIHQGRNFSQLSHLKEVRLKTPYINIDQLNLIVKHMKDVEALDITVSEMTNEIVESLTYLKNLKKLTVEFKTIPPEYRSVKNKIKLHKFLMSYNKSIKIIKLIGGYEWKDKKEEVSLIFKRLCKSLVVV